MQTGLVFADGLLVVHGPDARPLPLFPLTPMRDCVVEEERKRVVRENAIVEPLRSTTTLLAVVILI